MQKVTKIFGPPGTGKTTRLLEIVEKALEDGIKPEEIAYVSFSKKAADEAVGRACKKFKLDKKQFRYFRTLHSLGYFTQGLSLEQGMAYSDYLYIANLLGLEITEYNDEEDSSYGFKNGDQCMQLHRMCRSRMISLEEEFSNAGQLIEVDYPTVEQWVATVESYKQLNSKHDFEDMLEGYSGALPVKVFIVDEAQDLSNLQWWVVEQAWSNAERLYIAGDDDQAIYNWNGANVKKFLSLEADEEIVLPKSWRLLDSIWRASDEVSKRIQDRKQKSWHPRAEGGEVVSMVKMHDLPLSEGEWYILVRNTRFLFDVENHLKNLGYIYNSNRIKGKRSIRQEQARLIQSWEALRKGEEITTAAANEILSSVRRKERATKRKVSREDLPFLEELLKRPWYEVLSSRMSVKQMHYIRSCLRNNQKLTEEPRITVSTIHKVKGGESENVAIVPDYSSISYKSIDSDDEHRLQYVAMTRAKKRLFLLSPQTDMHYKF